MKKMLVVLMTLCMIFGTVSASAAGRLSVVQEDFHVIKDYSLYGIAYARIENVGNKPMKIHAGILEIFDKEGDTITSTDKLYAYAQYLEPGEYTYVKMSSTVDDVGADDVDDYLMTVTGKSDNTTRTHRFPCEAEFKRNVKSGSYYTYDYLYVTVTNDTDEIVYGVNTVVALIATDDTILYVGNDYLSSNKGILPGSSVIFRYTLDSDYVKYYDENDYEYASVDAIAYVNEEIQ